MAKLYTPSISRIVAALLAADLLLLRSPSASAADAPTYADIPSGYFSFATMPNGEVYLLGRAAGQVRYRVSTDDGVTFGTTDTKLFDSVATSSPIPVVIDSSVAALDGDLHVFQTKGEGSPLANINAHYYFGPTPSVPADWTYGGQIYTGWLSSAFKAAHVEYPRPDGLPGTVNRLLFPFHTRERTGSQYGADGKNDTRVMYKNLPGGGWNVSPTIIRAPVPSNWNGADDGAVEPTIAELSDGTLQMWMRSQTGRLTTTTSTDHGATWTVDAQNHAADSSFYTTTGNPNVQQVGDKLVMIWTNGTMPLRHNNAVWYSGRDALHAAVSDDDGVTWKGFREIILDPRRELVPAADDAGVAQSFSTATASGRIMIATGQGLGRKMIRLDPDWLLERDRSDAVGAADATTGAVENWSLWTDYGNVGASPAPSTKRARYRGTDVVNGATVGGTGQVLKVQKDQTGRAGSGAVWNFPSAKRARTSARVRLESGSDGAYVVLTDRFFNPTDDQGHDKGYYRLDVNADGTFANVDGSSGTGASLTPGNWYDLTVDWNLDQTINAGKKAVVRLGGAHVGTISARTVDGSGAAVEPWAGLSYLRFRSRSAGSDTDTAGFLIDSVAHDGSKIRDAQRMTSADVTSALTTDPGWTRIKFDDYVPNAGATGTVASFAGTFDGFVNPSTGADPIGLIVQSSTGTVTFSDNTSAAVTSDLLGPQSGQTLSLKFVDPADGTTPATVSDLAFRLGSVAAANVTVRLFDVEGHEMPDWVFTKLDAGTSTSIGYTALEDLEFASALHEIRLTATGTDVWLLGSFNQSPLLFDFAYKGFTLGGALDAVPEPSSLSALAATWPLLFRRRGRHTRRR